VKTLKAGVASQALGPEPSSRRSIQESPPSHRCDLITGPRAAPLPARAPHVQA